MFLELDDFNTILYEEIIEIVSREDETLIDAAIDAAISEAKGYMTDLDIGEIFDATGTDRNPLLLIFLKDIAAYHFLSIGNPAADIELRKARYERAVKWLEGVQKGSIVPDLPRKESEDTQTGFIRTGSNPQRTQHF